MLPVSSSLRMPIVPERVRVAADKAALHITDGLPTRFTAATFEVGAKGGTSREVHLLPPGLHPAHTDEAFRFFAWNAERQALWKRLESAAPELRRIGVTHVALGGSYFSTDHATPGDIDGAAFVDPLVYARAPHRPYESALQTWTSRQPDDGIHMYDATRSLVLAGGPNALSTYSHAPTHPRPARIELGTPRGPEVGMVLLDLDDFP